MCHTIAVCQPLGQILRSQSCKVLRRSSESIGNSRDIHHNHVGKAARASWRGTHLWSQRRPVLLEHLLCAGHHFLSFFFFSFLFSFSNYKSMTVHLQETWKIQNKVTYSSTICCSLTQLYPTLCDCSSTIYYFLSR